MKILKSESSEISLEVVNEKKNTNGEYLFVASIVVFGERVFQTLT